MATKLLWISDAGRPTGFGTVTHALGERLIDMGHEIHVLAVGWDAAFPVDTRLKLYRAAAKNPMSYLGMDRTAELIDHVQPDLVVLNEDVPMMLRRLLDNKYDPDKKLLKKQPVVAYVPIDGTGLPRQWTTQLPQLVTVVPYTNFAAEQLGVPKANVVYHGIDPVWRPLSEEMKLEVRAKFEIPHDAFVIGRVDTNSGRKDWGSTWKVIDTALQRGLDESKTVALFHTKLKEVQSGVDLRALISRGRGKYIVTDEDNWPVEELVGLMNCFDVFLTTSRGEGFGLNVAQAMACGIPIVATGHSSMSEVVGKGGYLLPGIATMTNPYGIDLVLANTEEMANALVYLQNEPGIRASLGTKALDHVKQFDWDVAAEKFDSIIRARLAA